MVLGLFTRKYIFNKNPVIGYALAKTSLIFAINYGKGNTLFSKYASKNNRIWMLNTVLANIESDHPVPRTVQSLNSVGVAPLCNLNSNTCTKQRYSNNNIPISILLFEFKIEYIKAITSFSLSTTSGTNRSLPFLLS